MSSDNAGIRAWVTVTAPVEGNADLESTPGLPSKEHWWRKQWNNKKAWGDIKKPVSDIKKMFTWHFLYPRSYKWGEVYIWWTVQDSDNQAETLY